MEDMDIVQVLDSISNGEYKNLYWGPCASTGNTYDELSEKWPTTNPTLPTEEEMEGHWQLVSTMDMSQVLATINGGIYAAFLGVVPQGASYGDVAQVWPKEKTPLPDYLDCLAHWESIQSEE